MCCFRIVVVCGAGGQIRCCITVTCHKVLIESIQTTAAHTLGFLACTCRVFLFLSFTTFFSPPSLDDSDDGIYIVGGVEQLMCPVLCVFRKIYGYATKQLFLLPPPPILQRGEIACTNFDAMVASVPPLTPRPRSGFQLSPYNCTAAALYGLGNPWKPYLPYSIWHFAHSFI